MKPLVFRLSLLILFLSAACQQASPVSETAVPNTSPPPTTIPDTATDTLAEQEADSNTPVAEEEEETAVVSSDPIGEEEARSLMFNLSTGTQSEVDAALARILAADDKRFIGVLLELFRASQIGLTRHIGLDEIIPAMEQLSGQAFNNDWGAWIEWYGTTDHTVPDGFVSWKGRILAGIDVRFGEFLQDRYPINIRPEEIVWGGVVVDGIPPLDNPTMIAPEAATYLNPWDPVFGLSINGDSRAYPLRIIDWHEMANDVVGGVPVSIAYCTLCGAAIAYDGRASDGNEYTFSSSGFLFRSNKLMYDRQTQTLWNQLTGEPVLGELVETDIELTILPIVLTTWAAWQEQHPDTVVVDQDTGVFRDYTLGAAYGDYFAADITMFPVWQRSDARDTKEFVFALNLNNTPKAYPVERLTEEQVVNDTLGGQSIVLVATRGIVESEGQSLRAGPVTYQSGAEVRAYERSDQTFSPGPDANTLLDADGQAWEVTEDALLGPNGETLSRLGGHLAYWFGWFAFYPDTLLYE